MEWLYVDNIIPIHAENISIEQQYPVVMFMIKKNPFFSFETIIGSRKDDLRSVTLKFVCCEINVTFQPQSFTEKYTLMNSFTQGLVLFCVIL